ncbi:hypothetical protein QFC19_008177 [Naganishia cerealis]|uniref:Uncharacterized protein n=1 Tax=Naganishia cerealis TaxID=610337 RepID=A0ACC2V3V9_9TREE|nr:hypothetical protein QFC19_008177 [Naganishia cerealis]
MHVFHPRHLKPPERGEMVSTIKAICKRWGFWTDADAHRISRQQRKNASDGLEFEQGQAATTISQGTDAPRSLDNAGFTSNQPSESRRGIIVFSHSNGSIAHKWLVTLCPEMILKNAFVDPVVFCLWEGGR